jgi:transcriptional regulator with XRE-family HTH domain
MPRFIIVDMPELKDAVRAARIRRGWSQGELARAVGVTPQAIQAIEAGRVKKPQNLTAIARKLGVNPEHLLNGSESSISALVDIVGIARAGSGEIDYSSSQGVLGQVEAPEMATERTVALEVRGDSMGGRIEDGDLVFYDDRREPVTPDLLGRVCVICRADDTVAVKKLMAGSKPGHFHLISYSAPPEFDVPVKWAAKVTSIRPK